MYTMYVHMNNCCIWRKIGAVKISVSLPWKEKQVFLRQHVRENTPSNFNTS